MRKQLSPIARYQGSRRSRFSLLLLTGLLVPAVLILVAAAVFVLPKMGSHAAAATNGDCTLIVPPDPLSSRGLSTPYQLVETDAANGPCNEANATQAAFVQAAALDPVTGTITVYDPLVIDQGTQPAAAPVVPTLPTIPTTSVFSAIFAPALRAFSNTISDAVRSSICDKNYLPRISQ